MGKRILIIEDQPDQRGLLRLILSHAGYEVESARNGGEGLDLAERKPFDAFLIDFYLPDRNGIELAEALHHLSRAKVTPVIMLSAEHNAHVRLLAERVGVTHWLSKPVRTDELLHALGAVLGVAWQGDV